MQLDENRLAMIIADASLVVGAIEKVIGEERRQSESGSRAGKFPMAPRVYGGIP